MFERFTDQARRVMVLAQEQARMLHHERIAAEHILLGLIHEGDGMAAQALESLGISLEAVRQQVEEIIGQGRHAPPGRIPLTPQAKTVMKLSLREALQMGHSYIGTEHLLLGVIREGQGVAAQVLAGHGADLSRVRQQVLQILGSQKEEEQETAHAAPRTGPAGGRQRELLSEVLDHIESIASRLSAIDQRVGTGPDIGALDQQIARVRRDKESAVGAEDYENAAALRDRERQLVTQKTSRQEQWATAHPDLPALAEGLHRLSDEVERLRRLLRQQGIEPQDGAA